MVQSQNVENTTAIIIAASIGGSVFLLILAVIIYKLH